MAHDNFAHISLISRNCMIKWENGAENHTHPIGKLFRSHHKRQRYLIFFGKEEARLGTMIQYFAISILIINICSLLLHTIYTTPQRREARSPMGYDSKWKVSTLKVVKMLLLLIKGQNQIKLKDSYLSPNSTSIGRTRPE